LLDKNAFFARRLFFYKVEYKNIVQLLRKDFLLEWRYKSALSSIFLYVLSTTFVAYLSFKSIVAVTVWNALFWIILLFAATNVVAKSFEQDYNQNRLYLYTLVSPQEYIVSKLIYNAITMAILAITTFLIYILLIGNLVQDIPQFLLVLISGAVGLIAALTLVAAIAVQSGNNLTLMSILGFPIVLPLLITLIKASKNAIDGLDFSVNVKYLLVILLLNVIIFVLSFLLFPYLWRD